MSGLQIYGSIASIKTLKKIVKKLEDFDSNGHYFNSLPIRTNVRLN